MEKTINSRNEEQREQRDLVDKYAPHACCMALLLSAAIIGGVIYLIYQLIKSLI